MDLLPLPYFFFLGVFFMARGVSTINTWWKYWKMHSVVVLPPPPAPNLHLEN